MCIAGPHILHVFSFSKAFGMMGWCAKYLIRFLQTGTIVCGELSLVKYTATMFLLHAHAQCVYSSCLPAHTAQYGNLATHTHMRKLRACRWLHRAAEHVQVEELLESCLLCPHLGLLCACLTFSDSDRVGWAQAGGLHRVPGRCAGRAAA